MINLLQFGTFDVSNYGDLLFPLIAKQRLGALIDLELQPVSPIGGAPQNLYDCAPCSSFLDVVEDASTIDGVLIGGGNIIHCMPSRLDAYVSAGRGNVAYGDLWIAPAFYLPEHVPILWNAPGVPNPFKKAQYELVTAALKRANYLSVRDELSRQYLLDVWPDADVKIVPDSAWTIDTLWSRERLFAEYRALFSRLGTQMPERSIVFHLNRRYLGNSSINDLARQLDAIANQVSARPILIAIGRCHGDEVIAREVANSMASHPILLENPHSLIEIAACIAFASVYAGSSMHGLITACAFGVPGVSVANRSMAKFSGLSSLTKLSDLIVPDWNQAMDVIRNMDFDQRKADMEVVHSSMHDVLKSHWDRICEELERTSEKSSVVVAGPAWRAVMEYQRNVLDSQMEVFHEDYQSKQQMLESKYRMSEKLLKVELKKQKEQLEAEIMRLRAKIKTIHRSISWRVTRPLRLVSERFPYLRALTVKGISALSHLVGRQQNVDGGMGMAVPVWEVSQDVKDRIKKYKESPQKGKRKLVLYTAVYGDYENLLLPEVIDDDLDYVCFTDRPLNDYGVWKIRCSPFHHSDPTRVARYIKTHPHELFPDHDFAVWLDGNIILRGDIRKYINLLKLKDSSLGLIPHPHRNCFYEEAEACKRLRKDVASVIDAQVDFYEKAGIKKDAGLFETGFMIVRLSDKDVSLLFRIWWQHIEKFSRRDQLALVWALAQINISVTHLLPGGVTVREDEDFLYFLHAQCKRLRTPLALLEMGAIRNPFDARKFVETKQDRLAKLDGIPIDIIVCVYNALEDVRLCLNSAYKNLQGGHRIIIVNDCSDNETTAYLRSFAAIDSRIHLIENDENLGYTRSANRGMAAGTANFRILLNSDTIVEKNWALKLLDAAMQSPDIGIVGPLSNAAGAQSVPDIKGKGTNTAINSIPEQLSCEEIDLFLERTSPEQMPQVPLVHGFCFGVKREVIDQIGFFDSVNFARYYGEENDYCLRASAAGFRLAVATNTFVFHRKSRSIEEEDRIVHMSNAGKKLRELYGAETIKIACTQIAEHPVLRHMREKVTHFFQSPDVDQVLRQKQKT